VQLRRRPEEAVDEDLQAFYKGLLKVIRASALKEGSGACAREAAGRTTRAAEIWSHGAGAGGRKDS